MLRLVTLITVSVASASLSLPAVAADWSFGPSLSTARAGCGVAIDPACRIFASGGRLTWTPQGAAGTATDTVEVFDASDPNAQWTAIPQAMAMRRELHATVCVNGFLYVFGGSNTFDSGTVYYSTAERLDLLNPTAGWQPIPDMPTPRNIAGAVADNYGRIYVIGGSNADASELPTVERFDPARNRWQTLPPLKEPRGRPGVARDVKGHIYVIGGGINLGTVATVEIFDPAHFDPDHPETAWQSVASIPDELELSQAVTATTGADGRIYVFGGVELLGSPLSRCIRYDPESDSWELWVSLPEATSGEPNSAVTDCNGRMWLIGAHAFPASVATTYVLSGPCGAASAKPALVDVDANGVIDVDDLLNVIARWGNCPQ